MMSSSRDRDLDQIDRGSLRATVSRCRDRIEHLELMVLELRKDHYGPSSERSTASDQQLSLGLIEQQRVSDPAGQPSQPAAVRLQPASVRKSRALPEHLRREVHTHLPDGKHCPDCGGTLRHLGEDVSEMLEYIPASFVVIRHVRPKFSCSHCCSVVQAAAPSRPVDRGLPGPSMLAHVITSKYADHVPLYRQAQIFADITERLRQEGVRKAEQDRLADEAQKTADQLGQTRTELKALSAYLINAQERERKRLARELHDDFGQRLALLGMHINRAMEQLRRNPNEVEAILENISGEISQLNTGLREISHRLHPTVLKDLGLVPALRTLIDAFSQEGIDLSFKLPDEIPALSADAVTALYRIAQEALTNALKHAPGAPVHVSLGTEDNSVQLTIRDGGPGFDLTKVRLGGGLGILNMNERARLVNGTFLLNSRPGDGTVITVRVPIENRQAAVCPALQLRGRSG